LPRCVAIALNKTVDFCFGTRTFDFRKDMLSAVTGFHHRTTTTKTFAREHELSRLNDPGTALFDRQPGQPERNKVAAHLARPQTGRLGSDCFMSSDVIAMTALADGGRNSELPHRGPIRCLAATVRESACHFE
jgi:hypothetical protein